MPFLGLQPLDGIDYDAEKDDFFNDYENSGTNRRW